MGGPPGYARAEIETDDREMGGHTFERDARRSPTLQPTDGGSRHRGSGGDEILAEAGPEARAPGLATDVDKQLASATSAPLRWTFSGCHVQIMALDSYQTVHAGIRAVRRAARAPSGPAGACTRRFGATRLPRWFGGRVHPVSAATADRESMVDSASRVAPKYQRSVWGVHRVHAGSGSRRVAGRSGHRVDPGPCGATGPRRYRAGPEWSAARAPRHSSYVCGSPGARTRNVADQATRSAGATISARPFAMADATSSSGEVVGSTACCVRGVAGAAGQPPSSSHRPRFGAIGAYQVSSKADPSGWWTAATPGNPSPLTESQLPYSSHPP